MIRSGIALCIGLVVAAPVAAQTMLGSDAAACQPGGGPAIAVEISGLKDRTGELKLELYPGEEADFLKDDSVLIAAGKTFRRVTVPTPATGPTTLCIRVPKPGRYALLLTHNRDGKNKFSVWTDGAGFASNAKLGRSRPKVAQALVEVGAGVTVVHITAQYLRGLGGLGPIG
ncbi:uncharacterized protein (DUF2141 family) [Sphingomonas sp. PP-CE-3A-406]|uniref:DUF2141 domain-containing protein n=1 Tax=Sphingomonas sp. PP-CE-3A-406 TaxID=2135659 RepID=UPI000EF9DEA5|nr:DUF2141 domain-containing protein [Sphingomonas sp. PP-CE-3A-406]RMB51435.1 uncharacterized protein (DUF2141 family) [Sphingomonas sp. PP-CE-3A-406]